MDKRGVFLERRRPCCTSTGQTPAATGSTLQINQFELNSGIRAIKELSVIKILGKLSKIEFTGTELDALLRTSDSN